MKFYLIPVLLLIFGFNAQSQIRKYTFFATGEGRYSREGKNIYNPYPGIYQLEGGFFILNNLAIGGNYLRNIPDKKYSGFKVKNWSYSVFMRAIYDLKPGLYFFWQPTYKVERFSNILAKSNIQTGSLKFGVSAFLTKNIALEIMPISVSYSHYIYKNDGNSTLSSSKTEESEFLFRFLSDPQLFTLKIFLNTDTLNVDNRVADLNNRKLLTGSIKYRNIKFGDFPSFELGIAPSLGIFISKHVMGGISLGFNYSKFETSFSSDKHVQSEFYFGPFFRFNCWLNSNTYLFISPHLRAGLKGEEFKSYSINQNNLSFLYNAGFNLGISTFISPRVVLETYTGLFNYQSEARYSQKYKYWSEGPRSQSLGLSLTNLYLSVGWLVGKGD